MPFQVPASAGMSLGARAFCVPVLAQPIATAANTTIGSHTPYIIFCMSDPFHGQLSPAWIVARAARVAIGPWSEDTSHA